MMRAIAILAALAVLAVAGAALFIYSGVYNVGATLQHTAPVYWILEVAMRRSVLRRAPEIVPPLTDRATIERGLRLYHTHCVNCHGAPGIAPDGFALGMMPLPANLVLTARRWQPAEIYWVVRYGVKTSGMPAWEFRLADPDLWAIVAFIAILPTMSADEYRDRVRTIAPPVATSAPSPESGADHGDAERGKVALQQYACIACHVIPGVVGANNPVGPSLAGIASRKYLAGVLPNGRENMIRFLRAPQQFVPHGAMPDLGVGERDARDMAMFLETLK
jgi:mono/diheme cytochrome c family protein